MEKEELLKRIEAKKNQITKLKNKIEKYTNAKTEEAFIKDQAGWYSQNPKEIKTMDDLVRARMKWSGRSEEEARAHLQNDLDRYYQDCDREVRGAQFDIREAELTLQKYENALKIKTDQGSVVKIPVIVEFLNRWKDRVEDWTVLEAKQLKAAYEYDVELCDKHNSGWYRDHPEADYRSDYRAYKEMMNDISDLTKNVYSRRTEDNVDHTKLKEILDKEAEARYFKLVNQVTKYVGEINDASDLRIGVKGDLEGVINGTTGSAYVRTIGAGGYHTDSIVNVKHGQCFHYRVICTPISD